MLRSRRRPCRHSLQHGVSAPFRSLPRRLASASEAMVQARKEIDLFIERRLRTEATTSAVLGAERPEDELRTLSAESLQGMKDETARAQARIEASARTEKEDREKLVALESEIDALRLEGRNTDAEARGRAGGNRGKRRRRFVEDGSRMPVRGHGPLPAFGCYRARHS